LQVGSGGTPCFRRDAGIVVPWAFSFVLLPFEIELEKPLHGENSNRLR
jgi:hypothetical protein